MSTPYEIFPSSVILYPGDKQDFAVRGAPPPSYWTLVVSASIETDHTLLVVGSPTDLRGFGAYGLRGGIGRVKFTITPNCLPTTGGYFDFYIVTLSTIATYRMECKMFPTQIEIHNHTTLLETIPHTAASGDVLEIELAGDTFRFYLNGVLETTYLFAAGNIATGAQFAAVLDLPVNTAPARIPQPELTGEWEVNSVEWLASAAGGSVSGSSFASPIHYAAGTAPGIYTLQARPDQLSAITGKEKETVAPQIVIPPLSVIRPNKISLNPSERAQFKTNYAAAQKKIVTWAVITGGGGSFDSADIYTAPTAIGDYIIRASSGLQRADITVTVKPVITATPNYAAAQPGEGIVFTTNIGGSITWTADYGTASGSGASFSWTAPNVAGPVAVITATNGTTTVTLEVPVLNKFAYDPSLSVQWERQKTAVISRAEDRSRSSRVKDKDGLAFEPFELSFKQRELAELQAVLTFWDAHYPGKRFIYEDKLRTKRMVMYFDSAVRVEGNARCGFDYAFRATEG